MSATTVSVLGSTGSIGTQTLDIVRAAPHRFKVRALGAQRSVAQLAEQARCFAPEVVALADPAGAGELAGLLPPGVELLVGDGALAQAAECGDVVINGVVGFAGLPVTLAALRAGKRLGLANKESLIAAGPVVREARATPGAQIVPVDSEHCAVHQCLRAAGDRSEVSRVVLTASGGPFRGRSRAELGAITTADALAHPTWQMGPKITVDSSTLMNKGLEVIEAHELFDVNYDQIDVVVHPQSVVHSMVTFCDGATVAQLSLPDMRMCIGYALAHPHRLGVPYGAIDWTQATSLHFEPPDREVFECLELAYAAGREAKTAPAWMSAANEVAVDAFLEGRIGWLDIAATVDETLQRWPGLDATDVESVLHADAEARRVAASVLNRRASRSGASKQPASSHGASR